MTTTEPKTRTITLTGRPPVKIREDQWPVIAEASWDKCDNQYEFQANRKASVALKVRRNGDGRVLVYGVYHYSTQFAQEDDVRAAAGRLLAAEGDIPAAIVDTVSDLGVYDSLPSQWQPDWALLADEAIADLPAEPI